MMSASLAESMTEIAQLSAAERIQLAQDIWETVAAQPETLSLSEAQTQELDRRLAAYQENPQRGSAWQEAQQRVRGQK